MHFTVQQIRDFHADKEGKTIWHVTMRQMCEDILAMHVAVDKHQLRERQLQARYDDLLRDYQKLSAQQTQVTLCESQAEMRSDAAWAQNYHEQKAETG